MKRQEPTRLAIKYGNLLLWHPVLTDSMKLMVQKAVGIRNSKLKDGEEQWTMSRFALEATLDAAKAEIERKEK